MLTFQRGEAAHLAAAAANERRVTYNDKVQYKVIDILRPKMNCGVGLANCFFVSSPSLPWQHGRRQQGWYIRGTLKKQLTKPTPQLILGRSK